MTNAELIKALRTCADHNAVGDKCYGECPYNGNYNECVDQMMLDAAAALKAADKRIAELMPKDGEWIEKWRFKTDGTPFHKIGDMECSVCHGDMLGRYYSKYCPHCGALLRGENDERTDKA